MTRVVGLTGGIGSGKSTISHILENNGIPIIDTDIIARIVVKPNSPALKEIVNSFGDTYLNPDGSLNRQALRTLIFNNENAKLSLESILHPKIHEKVLESLSEFKKTAPSYIVVAIPLLAESIAKTGCKPNYLDEIWVVDCSIEHQINRAVKRDGHDTKLIKKIIAQQASRQERLAIADYVIENFSDIDALKKNVLALLNK